MSREQEGEFKSNGNLKVEVEMLLYHVRVFLP